VADKPSEQGGSQPAQKRQFDKVVAILLQHYKQKQGV
jgi:hypothetical protein